MSAGNPGDPVAIVCAYPDNALPSAWFQAVQRIRRTVRRAGYQARVDLAPASAVPADADVVIALLGLTDALAGAWPEVLIAQPATLGKVFDELVERLVATDRLRRGPEPPRTIAVHRGFQAVGERARVAE